MVFEIEIPVVELVVGVAGEEGAGDIADGFQAAGLDVGVGFAEAGEQFGEGGVAELFFQGEGGGGEGFRPAAAGCVWERAMRERAAADAMEAVVERNWRRERDMAYSKISRTYGCGVGCRIARPFSLHFGDLREHPVLFYDAEGLDSGVAHFFEDGKSSLWGR